MSGLCECGCGEPVPISKYTDKRHNAVKGKPLRFILGHHARGSNHPQWNGGRTNSGEYQLIRNVGHPRSRRDGEYVREHILVIEKSMGRLLPPQALGHHVDEDKSNNHPSNLVACENSSYHMLLHRRTRAYRACGYAHWRKCIICHQYDDPKNMYVYKDRHAYHRKCKNQDQNRRKRERTNRANRLH